MCHFKCVANGQTQLTNLITASFQSLHCFIRCVAMKLIVHERFVNENVHVPNLVRGHLTLHLVQLARVSIGQIHQVRVD